MDARRDLIEAEAKRRCIDGGYTLETPAKALTSYSERSGPLWKAFVPKIENEIARIEDAGFVVRPDPFDWDDADEPFVPAWVTAFFAGMCFAGLLVQFARGF